MRTRKCPKCETSIVYQNYQAHYMANKRNSVCAECKVLGFTGKNNPFFGKKHSPETVTKMSESKKGKPVSETQYAALMKGRNSGKSPYQCWFEKHGKEYADAKMRELKQKQSAANLGEKNSMYGKPSPQGAGNGWSGWYKGWFFRSILELSFMVNVIEKQGIAWKSAETNEYKIPYVDPLGRPRNYFADFVLEDTRIVECKPRRLQDSPLVLTKQEGALAFCVMRGLAYEMVCPDKLTDEDMLRLYTNGELRFLPKYDEKFKERYLNVT